MTVWSLSLHKSYYACGLTLFFVSQATFILYGICKESIRRKTCHTVRFHHTCTRTRTYLADTHPQATARYSLCLSHLGIVLKLVPQEMLEFKKSGSRESRTSAECHRKRKPVTSREKAYPCFPLDNHEIIQTGTYVGMLMYKKRVNSEIATYTSTNGSNGHLQPCKERQTTHSKGN